MAWEIEPHESIEERISRDTYGSLSDAERAYHGAWWLFFVAYGPGLLTYFNETPRSQIDIAINALSLIGANSMRAELEKALGVLPRDYFDRPVSSRNDGLPESVEDAIYASEGLFTDHPYPEAALRDFVTNNDAEFSGPRSKLELWTSMNLRGADTSPKFTAKKFDRVKEAEKDRPYSSRSCPNCGYPSPDYRPSCKSCGYPHGLA